MLEPQIALYGIHLSGHGHRLVLPLRMLPLEFRRYEYCRYEYCRHAPGTPWLPEEPVVAAAAARAN